MEYIKGKNYWTIVKSLGKRKMDYEKPFMTEWFLCKCELCGNYYEKSKSAVNSIKKNRSTKCRYCAAKYDNTQRKIDYEKDGKLYNTWKGMKYRAGKHKNYLHVKVCDEWKDWDTFREWAYDSGYEKGLTIDRIDPKGNYEPSNCQWLSHSDNVRKANLQKEKTSRTCIVCGGEFIGATATKCRKCRKYKKRICERCGDPFWVSAGTVKERLCESCR